MERTNPVNGSDIIRWILIPAAFSLLVTLVRLIGELLHWSEKWFSTATPGIMPSGISWLIGITWLPLPFGVYFALKIAATGDKPKRMRRPVRAAVLGLIIMLGGLYFLVPNLSIESPTNFIFVLLVMTAAAAVQWLGWPALFKTLLAYGLAARVPVVIIMFFAMLGNWGTHYDYAGMSSQIQMSLWPKFFWLAFFPQLIFWVGFTVVIGSVTGSLVTTIVYYRRRAVQTVSEGRA